MAPPPDLVGALRALDRPSRPGLRWVPEHQWHVTLRFEAAVRPDRLVAALDRLRWTAPVTAEAGPAPTALSPLVWVLPVAGLEDLAAAVATAVQGAPSPAPAAPTGPTARRFRGHLTLARARRPGGLRGLTAPPVAARWDVQRIEAFRSELRSDGAVHHMLGRWPVGPG